MHKGSNFSTSLPTLVIFYSSHPSGCEVGILLWFWFAFPWWLMMLSIFSCAYWPFVYLVWEKCLSKSFAHFKIMFKKYFKFYTSLYILVVILLYICLLSEKGLANIFPHTVGCLLTFLKVLFEAKSFKIWWSPIYFFSYCLCLFVWYLRNHRLSQLREDSLLCFRLQVL